MSDASLRCRAAAIPEAICRGAITSIKSQASQMRIILTLVAVLLSCPSSWAANEEFPQQVRGIWADTKETCDMLKTRSPADLRRDQRWLKIAATDVLGTTQARFLREKKMPVQMVGAAPIKFLFEVQMADTFGLIGELSFKGDKILYLYETIIGAHSSRYYSRC
jgi:hypothetical protein